MPRSPRSFTVPLITPLTVLTLFLTLAPGGARAASGPASPDGVWREVERTSATAPGSASTLSAPTYRVFDIDTGVLSSILGRAPSEGATAADAVLLTLPVQDGAYERFRIQESRVFSPELAAENPGIQSFVGQGVDDATLSAHFVQTPAGFYAFIRTPGGMIYMEPNGIGNTTQSISYTRRDVAAEAPSFECQVGDDPLELRGGVATPSSTPGRVGLVAPSGATLSTYDLAVSTTGEFTQYFDPGGGTTNTLSQIAASVAAVNAIYMPEVTIRFVVTCNNVFDDPTTDPFTDAENSGPSLDHNQTSTDANCGDYDIGHVFHRRSGGGFSGLAGGNACNDANKARGYSSVQDPVPTTMIWIVDQLSHEMGHQFTAGHTFNSDVTGCSGNRSADDAYEPGSGSTIMSYRAGTRCDYDFPGTNDGYFHGHSFDEITNHRDGGGACGVTSATGNTPPTVNAGADYTIPQGTPFKLTASGSDANAGDALTYCWEQFDLGPPGDFATNVNGPLFRSYPPDASPTRTFPIMSDILAGNPTPTEILPLVDRTLNFRCTVRDNRASGGGVNNDAMVLTIEGDPFFVTSPDGGETLHADCLTTITWTVGGGDVATHVNILLSTNGGATFPTTLASNVPNDGSHEVRLPCASTTTQGRVLIEAVGNVFFDVSDDDFTIVNDDPVATMDATGGDVGATCEFLVPYSAKITDDCRIDPTTVEVTATSLDGLSTVDIPTAVVNVVGPDDVRVTGTVRVSALTGCPASVRVTITGEDECGLVATQSDDVEVNDTTPPEISVVLSATDLWPPNHKLHTITAEVTVSDNCPGTSYVLTSITSDEPENGLGDGDTAPDIVDATTGTADTEFQLRSERSGTGDGRVYTVTYTASDPCGNSTEATAEVHVEHHKAGGAHALMGIDPASGTVLPGASVIAYIVPGAPAYTDVDYRIVAGGATLANDGGTVTALAIDRLHYDADRTLDHLVVFDASQVRELVATGSQPIGLLYVTTAAGAYLVPDALRLGTAAALSDATLDLIDTALAGASPTLGDGGQTVAEPSGGDLAPSDREVGGATASGISVTRFRGVQPNPFRGTTAFAFDLASEGPVRLAVYSTSGRLVRLVENAVQPAGRHVRAWDGRDDEGRLVAPGIYVVRFASSGVRATAKAVLVR